jgi:hypothetical protein
LPAGLAFCSDVGTRRIETAAACCQEDMLLSIAPLTSAFGAMFAIFEVTDVETETVMVPFRQWYLEADASAELTKQLKSKLAASDLSLYRI